LVNYRFINSRHAAELQLEDNKKPGQSSSVLYHGFKNLP